MPLQVRTFSGVGEPGNLEAVVADVEADANAFLQTVATVDVADIRVSTTPFGKYGERVCHTVSVSYVE